MQNTAFYNKCKGLALVFSTLALLITGTLLSTAALIHSASPAQADAPQTMYATGKYQMAITSAVASNMTYWYILVWDSETGRSKFYYGSPKDKSTRAGASVFQLPSSPL